MREFGSEHPAIVLPDDYFASLGDFGYEELFLRSGREALLLAAITVGQSKENTILFPAYCCWSMSAPFEKAGWNVIYYRLNNDLTADIAYLEKLLKEHKPQAVLTMNFFGSASTDNVVRTVKSASENIVVIEDFSHCTFSFKQIHNPLVDIYVSSIRKSIGVSDGAVILSKNPMQQQYIKEEENDFAGKRFVAQTEKAHYTWNKNQDNKLFFLKNIRDCEELIDNFNDVRPISSRSMKMLNIINGQEIAYARRENMKHLWNLLNGKVPMVPGLERCFNGAPFSLPILIDNRDSVQSALAKKGVYTQWLWPICEEAQKICPVSKTMNDKMLSVPIDQRYSWDDIEDIARIIIEIIN